MREMTERVGKAIWAAKIKHWNPDQWDDDTLRECIEKAWKNDGSFSPLDSQEKFSAMARAAIAVMREPTEAMIEAGLELPDSHFVVERWQAMIDEALK